MREIKVAVINFSDIRGGAAIATSQQVKVLKNNKNVAIDFLVAEKKIDGCFSIGPTWLQSKWHFFLRLVALLCSKLQKTNNKVKHSLNIFSSNFIIEKLQKSDYEVIHFNWLNNETISINRLINILQKKGKQKFIFTLHDEWFFCGSEHCCLNYYSQRYLDGYNQQNKDVVGVDIDRLIFSIKKKLKPLISSDKVIFTAPSIYLVNKAKSSFLLKNSNIVYIPNIIDTNLFNPNLNNLIRQKLFIKDSSFVILFGAIGGASYLKGSDLLLAALEKLSLFNLKTKLTLLTFGGKSTTQDTIFGFDVINLGHIHDKNYLASIYSAADVTIVPSRLEAFGQVAAESLSCETPVIAFNNSGVTDIVKHNKSGYLVDAFDTDKLADYIYKIIVLSPETRQEMGKWGRNFVVDNFSTDVVRNKWLDLYFKKQF